MKRTLVSAALLAFFAGGVFAQEVGITGNVALTTNYKFRGQDQGNNKPAVQGGFDLSHGGFYLGNWNSSVGSLMNAASGLEADVYGGYKGELSGVGYDVGVLRYQYPGNSVANTTELYGAVSYGMVSAKYSHTVSKEYFGITEGRSTGYLDLAANYELVPGLTLNAHLGFTNFASDAERANPLLAKDYTDYKLGATYALGKDVSLAGAIVGATERDFYRAAAGQDLNRARFIVTLSKAL
ncbi:TorF family putative porin [Caldimonas tepidiphila]|uniref:TorF family putative porin n=1 Tax=Caldimonas tepidiphila TaxID=2315841 RepID=UPI001F0BBE5C|nr:TorF family putative porin [Caldimonas tepidiphila]